MLKGIDISHHNGNIKRIVDYINNGIYDFVIMKATEGVHFKDSSFEDISLLLNSGTLKGYYHFARPDAGNSPIQEADNFIESVKLYVNGFSLLALDVEAKALNVTDLDEWCLIWAKRVYEKLHVKPIIYCSQAECRRFKKCADFGCGLWVAKWSKIKPFAARIKPWRFFAIWQYTSSLMIDGARYDGDYFNGSRDQYLKYCAIGK